MSLRTITEQQAHDLIAKFEALTNEMRAQNLSFYFGVSILIEKDEKKLLSNGSVVNNMPFIALESFLKKELTDALSDSIQQTITKKP